MEELREYSNSYPSYMGQTILLYRQYFIPMMLIIIELDNLSHAERFIRGFELPMYIVTFDGLELEYGFLGL